MKVFTMVKDENDVVEDWVLYHGTLFGFTNLYVIDNYSVDGTFQTLLNLKNKYNINVTRVDNYKKKGEYMTELLRNFGNGEIVFPIDIDEFIVYYNKETNTISSDKNIIVNHINSLQLLPFYKMNYINAKIFSPVGYNRATTECEYGKYANYGGQAKTFFHSGLFKGIIDHGNHYISQSYLLSNLCLVHFHERNIDQIKKKVYNNVKGLGYNPFDLISLKNLLHRNNSIMGNHHIHKQIKILEKTFSLDIENKLNNDISLTPLNQFIKELKQ